MLPVEIIEQIFQYLSSLEDRKAASLVCRQWYEAYTNHHFRQYELIKIRTDSQFKSFQQFENVGRTFDNFILEKIDIGEDSVSFWEKHGGNIKSLTIDACKLSYKIFLRAMGYCKSLEELRLENCRDLFMTVLMPPDEEEQKLLLKSFNNLKSLDLSNNTFMSDAIINLFIASSPKLSSLTFNGCHISFHNGLFNRFYPKFHNEKTITPSDCVTTIQFIHSLITKNPHNLRAIAFCETLVDNNALAMLSTTENLHLNTLHLRNCQEISDQGWNIMCKNMTSLTELNLDQCRRVTDQTLTTICQQLRNLRTLSLRGCNKLSDSGLLYIGLLDQLRHLDLAHCEGVRGAGLATGLSRFQKSTLRKLFVNSVNIYESALITIVQHSPNLRVLDISYCVEAVTDTSIQHVFKHCTMLELLYIENCSRLSDRGLTGNCMKEEVFSSLIEIQENPNTSQSTATECPSKLTEPETDSLPHRGLSLSSLSRLIGLNMGDCRPSLITDISLKQAFKFKELRYLNLCYRSFSSEAIVEAIRHCPVIEELNIDGCVNVTDETILCILRSSPRLKILMLGSNLVTDTIAEHILDYGLNLRYINVTHCAKLTRKCAERIIRSLSSLRRFYYPNGDWFF